MCLSLPSCLQKPIPPGIHPSSHYLCIHQCTQVMHRSPSPHPFHPTCARLMEPRQAQKPGATGRCGIPRLGSSSARVCRPSG
jgi:hypothetical protein